MRVISDNLLILKPFMKKFYLIFILNFLICVSLSAQLPTAQQIASRMRVGWNLGNTLEAICGETAWNGGVVTTQALIDSVKKAGFNAVRLPCAWFCHSDTNTSVIQPAWIARVKQVVDYCIKDSMYVILNIHWDSGWLENRVDSKNQVQVNKRQYAYWTQIANYFKDYDEHLLFACANEPNRQDKPDGRAVFETYVQTFIKAVRATGSNNGSRTLIFQGDADQTTNIPEDLIPGRLMFEAHYYPFQFSLWAKDDVNPWCNCKDTLYAFYYWGKENHSLTDIKHNSTYGEEADVAKFFGTLKTRFVDKGVPIIVGEYGAWKRAVLASGADRALHYKSIEYFYYYMVRAALSNGAVPFCWDTNNGLFDRSKGKILDQKIIDSMMNGAKSVPVSVRTSKNPVCQGDTGVIYLIPNTPGARYKWTYSGTGVTILNDTLNAVSLNFSDTATSGKLTVNTQYPADSTWAFDVTVGSPIVQPSNITMGENPACAGDNIAYSVTSNPGTTYYWTYSGTGANFSNVTSNATSISYGIDATGGTLMIKASSNGCSNSRSETISVNTKPGQPSLITASKNPICIGDSSILYSVTKMNNVSYKWSYSGLGATVLGDSTNSIQVNYSKSATSGTLTVTASNGNCSNNRALSVLVKAPPAQPTVIRASKDPVCQGTTNISYSVNGSIGITYNWTYSGTGASISNSTLNPVVINYSNTATSGKLKLTVSNGTGCIDTSSNYRTFDVTVNALPNPPSAIISSKDTVLQGDSGITYSVVNDTSVAYNWTYNGNGATIYNKNSNAISVDYSSSATSGKLMVTAKSSNGCASSATLGVIVDKFVAVNSLNTNENNVFNVNHSLGNPEIILTYSINKGSQVLIDLIDIQGRLVTSIGNSYRQAGTYSISFNHSDLSKGVYIIRFKAGNTMLQKKLLLID